MTTSKATKTRKPKAEKSANTESVARPPAVLEEIKVNHAEIVFEKTINLGTNLDALVTAIKAAGTNQEPIKKAIYEARVIQWRGWAKPITREYAREIVDNKHNKNDHAKKALSAARSWVSALYKTYGIETTETRGGARGKNSHPSDDMNVGEIKFPKVPKGVTTRYDLASWIFVNAQTMYDFFQLNAEHDAVQSEHGSALMGACADFLDEVKTINEHYRAASTSVNSK